VVKIEFDTRSEVLHILRIEGSQSNVTIQLVHCNNV
jgi:hypothetical protein